MIATSKGLSLSLGITIILIGFFGGIGFLSVLGNNPAIAGLSDQTFAEYWQHLDRYMGARMPVVGPMILLSILISTIWLYRVKQRPSFWLMLLALLLVISDVAVALNFNDPLNTLIQSWDLGNLPADVGEIKRKVVAAFNIRQWLMMGSFAVALLSVWRLKGGECSIQTKPAVTG